MPEEEVGNNEQNKPGSRLSLFQVGKEKCFYLKVDKFLEGQNLHRRVSGLEIFFFSKQRKTDTRTESVCH